MEEDTTGAPGEGEERLVPLTSPPTTYRNVREFGAAHMFDGSDITCWNSAQGSPQWVQLSFKREQPVRVRRLQLMFQGGFVGQEVEVATVGPDNGSLATLEGLKLHPEDTNDLQISHRAFEFRTAPPWRSMMMMRMRRCPTRYVCRVPSSTMHSFDVDLPSVLELRLTFRSSTDFYGRITIYRLEVLGTVQQQPVPPEEGGSGQSGGAAERAPPEGAAKEDA